MRKLLVASMALSAVLLVQVNAQEERVRHIAPANPVVADKDVKEAMKFAFRALKLVVEPSGAAGLAAVLNGAQDGRGKVTAVVLSS